MQGSNIQIILFLFALIFNFSILICKAQDENLAEIEIRENFGLARELEYAICPLQIAVDDLKNYEFNIVALDKKNNEEIPCQIFDSRSFKRENISIIQVIFPVTMDPYAIKNYVISRTAQTKPIKTDLLYEGKGLDIIVENEFYRADLTKSEQSEAKSHHSGQLREILLKNGLNVRLFRDQNRMHWAPNFQNTEYDEYETIAGWDYPRDYQFSAGPYLVHTLRQDAAPRHPEILLTASYYFYSGLPYFRFYSSMAVIMDVSLFLLRNDEMTMDSLFTHVAFQRPGGQIEDLSLLERYDRLEERPIENDAPWLCFYNATEGYAFGSIRLKYMNKNEMGFESPVYLPHTKISDGSGGGKYWNRRLIHEYPTFVPKGSRYIEENAYLVFQLDSEDRFKEIKYWADRLHHPLQVRIQMHTSLWE